MRFSFRKLKKRAEKEKRREEKRKKKEAKKKRKHEESQNSEAPNASEPDSLDGSGKRRPGRPPKKDKEPKIPKPRGRPPKDPLKRLEKERQLQQAIEQHKKEFEFCLPKIAYLYISVIRSNRFFLITLIKTLAGELSKWRLSEQLFQLDYEFRHFLFGVS